MKKLLCGSALLVALGAGAPAVAADMRVKAPVQAAPAWSWTGCYIGVHGGGGVMHDWNTDNHGGGGLAGGQVGCNYQTGMLVLGVEAEGWWSGLKSTHQGGNFVDGVTHRFDTKNKWDYDVAVRFGLAFDRALVYGKAGVVVGRFDFDAVFPLIPGSETGSATLSGVLIGLGLEYAFGGNWSVKFEYDYLGYLAKDVTFTDCGFAGPGLCEQVFERVSADKHIFKFGLNYRFGS